ncbi:MAG: aminopeptidase [Bacteroidetes bacterium]|nr:aminopeptidase [Bacteroidota bacterium]
MKNFLLKSGILFLCILLLTTVLKAQDDKEKKADAYTFTIEKQIKATSVKNQYKSGTCWSFSTFSFIESELIRMGKGELDLSDMFCVRHAYADKAEKFVRMHGTISFGSGGAAHDVPNMIKKYGIVPEEIYAGLNYGETKHDHGELDAVLKAYVKAVADDNNKKLTTAWLAGFNGILDAYFGKLPETFTYNGKSYTPLTYAKELCINPDDYIEFSSYTHHPFYSKFIIEVPDNWAWGEVYNVPMNDMIAIIDNAINNGYGVAWGADVSEKGFSWKNGIAVVPDENKPDLQGSERDKWEKLSEREKAAQLYTFDKPVKEKVITQEMRQIAFDNYQTTDDHGMQICGIAKDQNGNKFYLIKNSWSTDGKYNGYFYASEAFVKYKTMDIMIHKDATPKEIAKKIKL